MAPYQSRKRPERLHLKDMDTLTFMTASGAVFVTSQPLPAGLRDLSGVGSWLKQHLTADESLVKGVCVILVIHWFAVRLRLRDCQLDTLYATSTKPVQLRLLT